MSVFFFFGLATVAGILSTLFWIPEDDLGRGYFQMNALVVLGLLSLVATTLFLRPFEPFGDQGILGSALLYGGFAAAFGYYFATWRENWPWARIAAAVSLLLCSSALVAAAASTIDGPAHLPHSALLVTVAVLTSSLLLGWSLTTMLLGHWYLVAPGLSFRHLVVFCRVLLGTVILRILAVAGTVLDATVVDPAIDPHPLRILTGLEAQGMFFWFRVLWGLAIPLLLAWMSLHCARQRSNQSATGILYVLVVGTFIGEITAFYLSVTTGVPA